MGKVIIKIPLVTWRDGRPRFIASAVHRALGYKGEDLRHGPAGPWFSLDETIAWSKARVAELAARREAIASGATTARRQKNAQERARSDGMVSVAHVVMSFLRSPSMLGVDQVVGKRRRKALAPNTVRHYGNGARVLEQFDGGEVWHAPAVQLTGRALGGILRRIEEQRGLAQTRVVRSTVQAAFKWGRHQRMVSHDPVAGLEDQLPVLPVRVRPGSVAEIETLIRGCDALGWPEMGDAIALGVWTGQRQADRLALRFSHIGPDGITIGPEKKNHGDNVERLLIPVSSVMARRLAAARARRPGMQPGSPVLINERINSPWEADWFRKVFRVLRHACATGEIQKGKGGTVLPEARAVLGGIDVAASLASAGIQPLASLADLRDQDLRDTCLSWLPMAGATKYEIAGFSGHAFGKSDAVLKHYLAIPPEFARAGMEKLERWHAQKLAELAGKASEEARA